MKPKRMYVHCLLAVRFRSLQPKTHPDPSTRGQNIHRQLSKKREQFHGLQLTQSSPLSFYCLSTKQINLFAAISTKRINSFPCPVFSARWIILFPVFSTKRMNAVPAFSTKWINPCRGAVFGHCDELTLEVQL